MEMSSNYESTTDKLSIGSSHYISSSAVHLSLKPCFMAAAPYAISVCDKSDEVTINCSHAVVWGWAEGGRCSEKLCLGGLAGVKFQGTV